MRLAPSLGGISICLVEQQTRDNQRCTLAAPSKLSMQETLRSTGKEAFRGQ